ncbi:hypothetical protein PFUGPA_01270 [Plasmodium falciparum Palo Alto/Uganda]|uniref:Uncharacterized protein n=1 Tax=Plasmodium falciparum (isolate Palo Alto / Uganda) TaxID=57270 RepID=W4J422_PLAFP|nr:hypothetical protein PFUGPA_01270 [Plasmodium falciparum Palo Alto/Uganda]
MNNHMGVLFLFILFLYKTYDIYKNKKEPYPFFVTSMIREEKNMDIDLSYKNDKNKIKFVLQGINHKDEYDSSLIILLPVEENYVDKLYEEYLKKAGDNPQHNSHGCVFFFLIIINYTKHKLYPTILIYIYI